MAGYYGFTFENYIRFFTKKYYYSALGRSIFVSVVTTITTLVVGVPIAYVMSRYNVWGKQTRMPEAVLILQRSNPAA